MDATLREMRHVFGRDHVRAAYMVRLHQISEARKQVLPGAS